MEQQLGRIDYSKRYLHFKIQVREIKEMDTKIKRLCQNILFDLWKFIWSKLIGLGNQRNNVGIFLKFLYRYKILLFNSMSIKKVQNKMNSPIFYLFLFKCYFLILALIAVWYPFIVVEELIHSFLNFCYDIISPKWNVSSVAIARRVDHRKLEAFCPRFINWSDGGLLPVKSRLVDRTSFQVVECTSFFIFLYVNAFLLDIFKVLFLVQFFHT